MAALKMAREAGKHDPDNITDAIGYLSLIPEVAAEFDPISSAAGPGFGLPPGSMLLTTTSEPGLEPFGQAADQHGSE